jgi:hypothetical protein
LPKLFTKFATKSYSRNRFGIIHFQEDYWKVWWKDIGCK